MDLTNKALRVGAINISFRSQLLPKELDKVIALITQEFLPIPCEDTVDIDGKALPIYRYMLGNTQLLLTEAYLLMQVENDNFTEAISKLEGMVSNIFIDVDGMKLIKFGIRVSYDIWGQLVQPSNFNAYFKPVLRKTNIFGKEFEGRRMPDLEKYKNGDFDINFQYTAFDTHDKENPERFILDFDVYTTKMIDSFELFSTCLHQGAQVIKGMFNKCISKKFEANLEGE